MNPFRVRWFAPAALAAVAWAATPSFGQHGQGGGHGEPAAQHEAPDTYAKAVAEIDERLKAIEGLIKGNKLDKVHAEAQVIVDIANTLAALALKPGSGVPREAIKEINVTAKALAGKFDAIDKAGDSGDGPGTRKVWGEMVELQKTLKRYASAGAPGGEHAHESYACPMHCEGTKTYDAPGKCPVCEMALKKITTDTYSVEVRPAGGTIATGKPVSLLFAIKDPSGAPVTRLETVHEKILHLLMVSRDLSWYAHEHPEVQKDGTFILTFTFPQAGDYVLFHDFTPPKVGQQVVQVALNVPGTAPAPVPLKADASQPKTVSGYTVTLDTGGAIETGGEAHLAYTITRDGKPVTDLQPYLGAMGHLVIISRDLKQFVHSHPHDGGEGEEHASGGMTGPKVDFEAFFTAPGLYKSWAQFQHMGKVITVPFTFEVRQGSGQSRPHEHGRKDPGQGHGGGHP